MATPIGQGFTGSEVAVTQESPGWIYSDVSFPFKPNPFYLQQGLSGDVSRVYDRNSIIESIHNIVLTNKYERPFKPNFGCNLRQFLFEPLGAWDIYEMEGAIRDQLAQYEPRINVLDVVITEDITIQTVNCVVTYEYTSIEGETFTDSVQIKIRTERVR